MVSVSHASVCEWLTQSWPTLAPASKVSCSPVPIFSPSALPHTQALERQKEFFDSIRSERDDLREEVVMLKEELKV